MSAPGEDDGDAGERLAEETVDESQLKLPALPAGWGASAASGATEDADTLLHTTRAALYVFSAGEWKARGTGEIKVLAMAGSGLVRLLLRQEKTLKVRLNAKVRRARAQGRGQPRGWRPAAEDGGARCIALRRVSLLSPPRLAPLARRSPAPAGLAVVDAGA
jgi:hypothetical protein